MTGRVLTSSGLTQKTPAATPSAPGTSAGSARGTTRARRARRARVVPGAARRRPPAIGFVAAALVLAAAITAVLVLHTGSPALAAGAWSAQYVAGTTGVRDASGTWWAPAAGRSSSRSGSSKSTGTSGTGLYGGTDTTLDTSSLSATGSPQLYRVARLGARSWTVRLPRASRYAVDLLIGPPEAGAAAGQNVFDVTADVGARKPVTLRRGVDPAAWTAGQPQHVTAMVLTRGTRLTIRMTPRRGTTSVTGLAVTSAPSTSPRTVLDDDFNGPSGAAPPAHWRYTTGSGPFGDTELQGYTNDRAHSHLDGKGDLEIVATRDRYTDSYGSRDYTSARLNTQGTVAVTYGRIETTLLPPAGQGLWSAVWAIGTNQTQVGWPRSGEIDVTEVLGSNPRSVSGHLHGLGDAGDPLGYKDQPVSNLGVEIPAPIDLTSTRHTSAVTIQPGAVTFFLDDQPFWVATREDLRAGQQWPVGHPYYLIANLAVGGWHGPPDSSTPFPGRLLIDRVRVQGWT